MILTALLQEFTDVAVGTRPPMVPLLGTLTPAGRWGGLSG